MKGKMTKSKKSTSRKIMRGRGKAVTAGPLGRAYQQIRDIIERARSKVARAVNTEKELKREKALIENFKNADKRR